MFYLGNSQSNEHKTWACSLPWCTQVHRSVQLTQNLQNQEICKFFSNCINKYLWFCRIDLLYNVKDTKGRQFYRNFQGVTLLWLKLFFQTTKHDTCPPAGSAVMKVGTFWPATPTYNIAHSKTLHAHISWI